MDAGNTSSSIGDHYSSSIRPNSIADTGGYRRRRQQKRKRVATSEGESAGQEMEVAVEQSEKQARSVHGFGVIDSASHPRGVVGIEGRVGDGDNFLADVCNADSNSDLSFPVADGPVQDVGENFMGVEVGVYDETQFTIPKVMRRQVGRLFSFLNDGSDRMVCADDAQSPLSSDLEEEAYQNSGVLDLPCSPAMRERGIGIVWGDDAVTKVYGTQQDLDERLSRMKWAMRNFVVTGGPAKAVPIGTFMMLWGILHLVGSKRWKMKDYDDMIRVMSLSVANASFLRENAWRETVDCNRAEENNPATYEMKSGPFIAPSSRRLSTLLPSVLETVAVPLKYYLVPINTSKTGGAKVVKDRKKAAGIREEKRKAVLVEGGPSVTVQERLGLEEEAIPRAETPKLPGHRSSPIVLEGSDSSGTIAVTSLEDLIKFDMLTPGIFHSVMREAGKEGTDPFSIYKIPAVAARSTQHNFSMRLDAIVPLHEFWENSSGGTGNCDEEEAVFAGRMKRVTVGVDDCVSVLTENAFDSHERLRFKDCSVCSSSVGSETTAHPQSGSNFVFNTAAAKSRSDSTTFEGRVVAVWMVAGCESWERVNRICVNLYESRRTAEALVMSGSDVPCGGYRLRKEYRSMSEQATPDEILITCLLSTASYGRKGDGAPRGRNIPSSRSIGATPKLPWSPLKAGDTASLIRSDTVCPTTCACMRNRPEVDCATVYAVVINRFWKDPSVSSTFVYVIGDLKEAIHCLNQAALVGCTELGKRNCPYGTSVENQVCNSEVLRTSTACTDNRSQSLHFMRRSCKVIAISDGVSTCSGDLHKNRHGYLEPHLRRECMTAVPTVGFLGADRGGKKYLIYRIVLYWDGFTQDSTRGSSAEGVYAQLLNLSPEERRSASAIRIMSLGPPGSDVRNICAILLSDLINLMVHGCLCVTADGDEIIVFPDLVAGLADTPALTQVLDTRGHNSLTPCTLCCYELKSEAGLGLRKSGGGGKGAAAKARDGHRYANMTTHSGLERGRRTGAKQEAIRDACPPDQELLDIGMQVLGKEDLPTNGDVGDVDVDPVERNDGTYQRTANDSKGRAVDLLPFHWFRQEYEAARDRDALPRNADGVCIYPGTFCPYSGILPGVEHLLVGLFKGAMKFALGLMSPRDKSDVNSYLTMYMGACGIPVQSQFVNLDSSIGLNTMSMSQSYAVSLFAERSLTAVLRNENRQVKQDSRRFMYDEALPAAIRLVRLISGVISLAWVKESAAWDKFGSTYVPLLQRKISEYVMAVDVVCRSPSTLADPHLSNVPVDDSDVIGNLGKRRGGGRKKKATMRSQDKEPTKSPSELARIHADSPNVHKVRELGVNILGNVGHLAKIAELAFEVRHGPMKSAIESGACTDSQLAAMVSAIFSDWSGRVAMTYQGALDRDKGSILAMVRFLFGEKDYLFCVEHGLSTEMTERVISVIGPKEFNQKFLKEHGVKLVGAQHAKVVKEGDREVWAAELRHSVLLRDSPGNRALVQARVVSEVESIRENSVEESLLRAKGGMASDHNEGPVDASELPKPPCDVLWVACVRKQWCSSLPSKMNIRSVGGLQRFMTSIVVGSIVRVDENCLYKLSPKWRIPMLRVRSDADQSLHSFGNKYTFWCVLGLFQVGSGGHSSIGDEVFIGDDEGGIAALSNSCLGVILAPCVYVDEDECRPTLGNIDYSRPLRVTCNALEGVCTGEGTLDRAVVMNPDCSDDSVVPVCSMSLCEKVCDGGHCVIVGDESIDNNSKRVVKHGRKCGALNGGMFVIRDGYSGYPPRSA